MTPEPALWNGRSRGPVSGGTSKKRRKNGSSSSGFCAPRSRMVPRVATFTTAGETFLIIGARVGSGAAASATVSHSATRLRCMTRGILARSAPRHLGTLAGRRTGSTWHRRCRSDRVTRVRLSGSLDGNASRLLLRTLRNADFEHPVDERRLDGLGVGALRKREAAQERAAGALDALVAVLRRLLLRAALALDAQHALVGGDVDVLALDARQIGGHHEALLFLVNVDVRDPADSGAVSALGHGAIELPLQAADERPRLVTDDGHEGSPVGNETAHGARMAPDGRLARGVFKSAGGARSAPAAGWRVPGRRRLAGGWLLPFQFVKAAVRLHIKAVPRCVLLWAACAEPVPALSTIYGGGRPGAPPAQFIKKYGRNYGQ